MSAPLPRPSTPEPSAPKLLTELSPPLAARGARYTALTYGSYRLEFLLEPGDWMTDEELRALKRDLDHVHQGAKSKLSYGLFSPSIGLDGIRDFLRDANLCVMRTEGEAAGFFYNVILQRTPVPIIHAGLVMIARNKGAELIAYPYLQMSLLQYRTYGAHYYTSITAVPFIIGQFADRYEKVWPSHKADQTRPPKEYLPILEVLERQYIQRYFPEDTVDRKRFVLSPPTGEIAFEKDIRKLPRHPRLAVNLFCQFWLDYPRGDALIQIGRVGLRSLLQTRLYLLLLGVFKRPRS